LQRVTRKDKSEQFPKRQVGAVPKKTSRRDDLKKKMKEVVSLLNFRVIRKMQRSMKIKLTIYE